MIAEAQLMGVLADDIRARTRAHVALENIWWREYESPVQARNVFHDV